MGRIAVGTVVAAHLGFIAYVLFGGLLACRFRRTLVLHVAAVGWAVLIVAAHLDCPLTALERSARASAGMAPLPPAGFIAHYLTGVVYPAGWEGAAQAAALALVAASWLRYLCDSRRTGGRYRERHAGTDHR